MQWTDDLKAELRRRWIDGETTASIGRAMGVSKDAVIGCAHRMALPARAGGPNWSLEDIAFFHAHAAWSDGKLADHFGKDTKTVQRARLRFNVGRPDVVIPRGPVRIKPASVNVPKTSTKKVFRAWQWTPGAERTAKPKKQERKVLSFIRSDNPRACGWFHERGDTLMQCDAPASAWRDNGSPCPEGAAWCLEHRRMVYVRPSYREVA